MIKPTDPKRWCVEEYIDKFGTWVRVAHFTGKAEALQYFKEVEHEIDMYGVPLHTPYRVWDKTTHETVCFK